MTLLRPFPFIQQRDGMDCGPACLKMVLKYYGREVGLEFIKRETHFRKQGVSLLDLSDAAEKFGLQTRGMKIDFEQLLEVAPLPCILYWGQYHFVVLIPGSNKKKLLVADPAAGIITLDRGEFLRNWLPASGSESTKGVALLVSPSQDFGTLYDLKDDLKGWQLLWSHARRYKKQLLQVLVTLGIATILQFIFPFITQGVVDIGVRTSDIDFIKLILLGQFVLYLGQSVVEFIRSRILLFLSTQINLRILSDFWLRLMRLPLSYFDSRHVGDILQRIVDHQRIEMFLTGPAIQSLFSILSLLVFSLVMIVFSPTIFSIFFIGSLLYLAWISAFLRVRRNIDYQKFGLSAKENSASLELVLGMHEIKLNNAEQLKRWEWESIQSSLFRLNFRSLTLDQAQQAGVFFINQAKNIFITYVAAESVVQGNITIGAMLALQYIVGQMNSPVEHLTGFLQQAQYTKISLDRLSEIQTLQPEEDEHSNFLKEINDETIEIENLRFAYPGATSGAVITNLSVRFSAKSVTAIVGPSGSGKTTILKLLQQFYQNYEGSIKIGGVNLKSLSPRHWRSVSGSVMQDGYIFNDTIERNITIGDENTDRPALISACKSAEILEFIEQLPLGFNTRIGTEGNGLSTGQRQRILIARAIYKNPKFLLFDEATNALDSNNEKAIMDNVRKFFEGRTVIVVAHRLSTIRGANKIVVVEGGSVVEQGTHEELIKLKGKYLQLVSNQLQ